MNRHLLILLTLALTACDRIPAGTIPCSWTRTCPAPTRDPEPTPEPRPTPSPEPTATPTQEPTVSPTPGADACTLPPGTGDGEGCPRTSPRLLAAVDEAVTVASRPAWLEGPGVVRAGHENDFRFAVVDALRAAGYCAFFDGEEIAVKDSNAFSEQYHVLSSARNIRRGLGSYRATCSPAWSAVPATVATPTPPPTPAPVETCPCLVCATVAFLGVNDGPAPELRPGDSITLDTTYRLARWDGDRRGAPAELVEGRNCKPPRGPEWTVDIPDGVQARKVNVGYGLRLIDLKAGRYVVSVSQPPNLTDGESPARSISACGWPAGDSVRSSIEFEVRP